MSELTTKKRNALKGSSFAIPSERAYPIHDRSHAQNALARVSQHGSSEEKKQVRAAVHRKYPGMGEGSKHDPEKAAEGTYGGKSNNETATLRSGNLPKPETVRDAKPQAGVAVKCAQKQNTSDGKDWPKGRNVLPNESDESIVAVGIVKVKE